MALPNLTSNSPVSGSIAWTAFGIQFAGTSYSIAAGSTANKFVWWEFATQTIKSASTLPALEEEDLLLFLNKNGVGTLVPMTDVMDGSLIVPQSILANAIAADQIDATHLKAGAVEAEHIGAGAVTTEKLTVGSVGDNLVTNGSFEEFANGLPLGWSATVEAGTGSADVVTGVSSSGAYAARLIIPNTTSGSRLSQIDDKVIPVSSVSGRSWYVSARVGASTAITKGFYLQVRWLDAAKALISTANAVADAGLTTSWEVKEGRVTPPSTARYMRVTVMCTLPNVAVNVYIDEVAAREVVVAAQIADNAITAAHIKADAIDGKTIRGVTVIGAEVKTTDAAGAISARMGPTAAYHFDGSVTFPGIGFVTEGAVGQRHAGMYSETGPDLTITQGGDLAYADNQAYVQLKDDAIKLYSRQPVSITGRNGVNIEAQVGNLALKGNTVTLNGVDMTAAGGKVPISWANGWMNFGGGYGDLLAKEITPGVVLLQGMAKPGTKGDGITIGVLPPAFRPSQIQNMATNIRTTAGSPNVNAAALVQVSTTGDVRLFADYWNYVVYATISVTYFL